MTSGRPMFAYGTLMFPDIIGSLLGRVPPSVPAVAPGFEVRRLHGVSYPGMIAVDGGIAAGLLLDDLTEDEITVLDEYEDDFYARVPIVVLVDGRPTEAVTYLVDCSVVMALPWTPEWFSSMHLAAFVGELGFS